MKIIKLISDTHNDAHELNSKELDSDILIHCGDFGTKGNFTEAVNFLHWFVKQPSKYKILVPGNHDSKIKSHVELLKLAYDLGIHILMDDYIEIYGLKIYGCCKVFKSENKNQLDQIKRKKAWKNIPKNLDLLITHMPPKYILDMNQEGQNCGCTQLTEKIKEVKPKYHAFGHIHEDGGKTLKKYDTIFMNCAVKNRLYITVRGPMEIKL